MSKAELRSQLTGPNDQNQRSAAEQYYVLSKTIKDIPNILNLVPNDGLAWVTGPAMDQSGIVALGEIDRYEVSGPERFSRAQSWWRNWSARTSRTKPNMA